jgi:polygalacturonase
MVRLSLPIANVSIALLALLSLVQAAPTKTCTVQKSSTDDALTIAQAFKDCQTGGTVIFPKGTTYYIKSLILIENLSNVNVQFGANVVLPNYDTKFNNGEAYFELRGENIHFEGSGTFVGTGQQWWDAGNRQGPTVFRAVAKNSVFRGFRITNAPRFHITMTNCENVVLEKIYLNSVSKTANYAYNTDAWGIAWSKNVTFRDSDVTNGDDCSAINGGKSYTLMLPVHAFILMFYLIKI